jgi:hypothetical protein
MRVASAGQTRVLPLANFFNKTKVKFIVDNWMLIAVALASGAMLDMACSTQGRYAAGH